MTPNRRRPPTVQEIEDAARCDHLALNGPGWTLCLRCGASCSRDEAGQITDYSAGSVPDTRGAA